MNIKKLNENEEVEVIEGYILKTLNQEKNIILSNREKVSVLLTDGIIDNVEESDEKTDDYCLKAKKMYLKDFSYAIKFHIERNKGDVWYSSIKATTIYLKDLEDKKALLTALMAIRTFKHQVGRSYDELIRKYEKPLKKGIFFEEGTLMGERVQRLERRKK